MPQNFPLVIVGGNSLIATYLMQRLATEGFVAEVISRKPVAVPPGFTFTEMDLTLARNWIAPEKAVVISLLPLPVLDQYLPRFIGIKSLIAVSSTSPFSKEKSRDENESMMAASLARGEAVLEEWSLRSNVLYTLFRPTLVYDGLRDKNIARVIRFIKRYHFFPVAAPAKGLRQPIHADDVAKAIVLSINNEKAYNETLNIAGSEILTYRAMIERIFIHLGMKPRLLFLPTDWLQKIFRWGSKLGIVRETTFGSSIFQRMNEDLVSDVNEGLTLLNYAPRPFELPKRVD